MKQEIDEFLEMLDTLCWEYHIEIKPTHPVPDDEYPTISIINGDEVVKLLYIDGEGFDVYCEGEKNGDQIFQEAKLTLREYILENKEKVVKDLEEMREKSNQNKMNQTALNWLYDQIENKGKCIYEVMEQALQMEKEQKITFAFNFYYEHSNKMGVPFNLISENKTNAEQYYNETFKSE